MIRKNPDGRASHKRFGPDPRRALQAAALHHAHSLAALSILIRRSPGYLHRYVSQGVPRALSSDDHAALSDFLGEPQEALGIRDLWSPD